MRRLNYIKIPITNIPGFIQIMKKKYRFNGDK